MSKEEDDALQRAEDAVAEELDGAGIILSRLHMDRAQREAAWEAMTVAPPGSKGEGEALRYYIASLENELKDARDYRDARPKECDF